MPSCIVVNWIAPGKRERKRERVVSGVHKTATKVKQRAMCVYLLVATVVRVFPQSGGN